MSMREKIITKLLYKYHFFILIYFSEMNYVGSLNVYVQIDNFLCPGLDCLHTTLVLYSGGLTLNYVSLGVQSFVNC